MTYVEHAVVFGPPGQLRVGILHDAAVPAHGIGVVIVVGGPQYRVGSHRQFVLLARDLAARGIAVLRFDQAGVGDSGGDPAGFDRLDEDVALAIAALRERVDGLRRVCLLGLCDGASATLISAPSDVSDIVLLNPWVRTETTLAQAYLYNYYGRRLRSGAFWRRILANPSAAVRAVLGYRDNRQRSRAAPERVPFIERMLRGAERFQGRALVLLSGTDTVAAEFEGLLARDARWGRALGRDGVTIQRLPAANHTFSRREWRDWVAQCSSEFLLAGR
jgi:exosortase A-associated hydrolase 1